MIQQLRSLLANVHRHPLNQNHKVSATARFFAWQLKSRLSKGPHVVPFVNNTRLVACSGMSGATMNIYTGLADIHDGGLLLHLLRKGDLFVDAGANVGSYTVLASGAIGANSVTIEPVPSTFKNLQRNLDENRITSLVEAHNIGLSRENGQLRFTSDADASNKVITDPAWSGSSIDVPVRRLDDVLDGRAPVLIKLDVEGWESEVLAGASRVLQMPQLLALIVEMNSSSPDFSPNERATYDCLVAAGFTPHAYDPFRRELAQLSTKNRANANTIFVRNPDTVRQRVSTSSPFRVLQHMI